MEKGVIRLTATSAIELADRLSREKSPGIEAGPELRYRCFLRALGIDDGDLRQATAALAELIRASRI
jgi:hypothetical protein